MNIHALQFYKCLADETRLSAVLLIHAEQELCVCELTEALQVSQPKISRHLAQLRECGLLQDRREGQWIYYQINPSLPGWAAKVIDITLKDNEKLIHPFTRRLCDMGDRPLRKSNCC
ncbi:MAG: ArsR family transcriptional regulator [Oceanicoccus sp.]|jgi:ArsR family transcriptional regulator